MIVLITGVDTGSDSISNRCDSMVFSNSIDTSMDNINNRCDSIVFIHR